MKGKCFKEPLFHATIEGRKTQFREIMKPQPEFIAGVPCYHYEELDDIMGEPYVSEWREIKPRYKVGEVVYLKEPYCLYDESYLELKTTNGLEIAYKYDNTLTLEEITSKSCAKWANKLFMPASAARFFIKITAVRAERLQDISEEDCFREGISESDSHFNGVPFFYGVKSQGKFDEDTRAETPRTVYAILIDSINGIGTWNRNPWVRVYDYELTEKN